MGENMSSLERDTLSRNRIVSETDENFFVEAGAGSGKKTDNTLFIELMKNPAIQDRFLKRFNECVAPEQEAAKIADIKKIYIECGVDEDARAEVRRYTEEAQKAVSKLKLNKVRAESLKRFAEKLVERAK